MLTGKVSRPFPSGGALGHAAKTAARRVVRHYPFRLQRMESSLIGRVGAGVFPVTFKGA
jgi:hypothetical protein